MKYGFFHNISTDIVKNFFPLFPVFVCDSEPESLHQIKKIVPLDGIRNKGKYEYQNHQIPDEFPPRRQRNRFINDAGMFQPEEREEECPDEPAYPEDKSHHDEEN